MVAGSKVVAGATVVAGASSSAADKDGDGVVTKEEFTSAVDEIKAMIEDKMGNKEEMKEEVIEEVKKEEQRSN